MTRMNAYHLLGRTGLRVSPLALGTMTFGQDGSWGSDENVSREVFSRYLESGGNFIDTADVYSGGRSEEQLGKFIRERKARDEVVLATKFSQGRQVGDGSVDPNAVGNGRKNMIAALEGSLRRLGTDYIDVYWTHIWDTVTPVEEVMSTFDSLVRSGKVRAIGLSNVPSWYAAKAQTLAAARAAEPVAALQMEYSLIEREVEREHVPAALDLGLGITAWGPLAGGLLTGKYQRSDSDLAGDGRLQDPGQRQVRDMLGGVTERSWHTLDVLRTVAAELEATPAQVAINWVAHRPGVAAVLVGARTVDQLDNNLAAMDLTPSAEQLDRLDVASAPPRVKQYLMHDRQIQRQVLTPGFSVSREPSWR